MATKNLKHVGMALGQGSGQKLPRTLRRVLVKAQRILRRPLKES